MDGTILIVDDDEDTAILLRDSLRKRGFDVDAVNSAQQCLEHLRTDPADVVVTDVQMTGMSGIDLCGELRQRYPDLLPLVLTGQGGLDRDRRDSRRRVRLHHEAPRPEDPRRQRRASRAAQGAAGRSEAPAVRCARRHELDRERRRLERRDASCVRPRIPRRRQ